MKKTLLAVLLAGMCGYASANAQPTYDYVDVGYAGLKSSDDDTTFTGFLVEGSKLVSDNVFVTGQWASVEESFVVFNVPVDADVTQIKLAVGYRYSVAPSTDVYGQLGYARQKLKVSASSGGVSASESESDDGYLAKLGVKHSFGRVEAGVFVERIDLGGDYEAENYIGIDGRVKFTDKFHGVVSYAKDSDVSQYKIGVSYAF